MSFSDGIDKFSKKLDDLQRNAKKLDSSSVPLKEIFTPKFLKDCSSFESFEDLVKASGFSAESQDEFDAIPEDKWNEFIVKNTTYASWQEMINEAAAQYGRKSLGL